MNREDIERYQKWIDHFRLTYGQDIPTSKMIEARELAILGKLPPTAGDLPPPKKEPFKVPAIVKTVLTLGGATFLKSALGKKILAVLALTLAFIVGLCKLETLPIDVCVHLPSINELLVDTGIIEPEPTPAEAAQ